ncbi:hypothetical protein HC931_11285 [Candidatus Gracilibacteria bacterium]|nr:hypothetical protein [Candidatus Gracilibacteria bacterium]NJM87655.1 hypothetical protein [Hydrococcus sp. RU_2_2]NJP20277.1 hypothetical protein [Hydrococcus sp. CRU_1_1]NJQ97209.1 hypothetical protein [Hydrococcus sp. CSU_1_8]
MVQIGTLVRVIYPDYAAGILGRIQAQEMSGRWIVRLEENPLEDSNEVLILSLEESDFEIIDPENLIPHS